MKAHQEQGTPRSTSRAKHTPTWWLGRWPVLMHRYGLGRLLGDQYAIVVHRGRRTGRVYETAVMTLRRDPQTARFMARHLGTGAVPSAAMLTELLQIMLVLGIAMPPTTTLLFRTFVTLEGTLRTLCPGYPLVQASEEFAADLVRERAAPATWKEAAQEELLDLMPMLRRAPRHLDHVATLIERGDARAKVSLFSDDRDARVVADLVNRVVLAVLGGLVGLMSVALLAVPGGPQVSPSTSLFDVFGYMGLFLATVVLLRALLAAMRG